jgi:hypothetical protein
MYVHYFVKPLTWFVSGGVLILDKFMPDVAIYIKKNSFYILIKVSISTHQVMQFHTSIYKLCILLPVVHALAAYVYLAHSVKKCV